MLVAVFGFEGLAPTLVSWLAPLGCGGVAVQLRGSITVSGENGNGTELADISSAKRFLAPRIQEIESSPEHQKGTLCASDVHDLDGYRLSLSLLTAYQDLLQQGPSLDAEDAPALSTEAADALWEEAAVVCEGLRNPDGVELDGWVDATYDCADALRARKSGVAGPPARKGVES